MEADVSEGCPSVQIQSALFYQGTPPTPPHPPGLKASKPQVLHGVGPRALGNLIYFWWLISVPFSMWWGGDSQCLVLILRFSLPLYYLHLFLPVLPVPLFCLPSMCCGNCHWKLWGQGMGFECNKVWSHHLAQQVPTPWLGWVSPFELQKYGKLEIAIIKRHYSMLRIITRHSKLLPA